MTVNKRIRLLSKTMIIYFIFVIIAFSASLYYLRHSINHFIFNDLERSFRHNEMRTAKFIEKTGKVPPSNDHFSVVVIEDTLNLDFAPVYKDSVMMSYRSNQEELFRRKKIIKKIGDNYYCITMSKHLEDFLKLKAMVFQSLFYAFGLLTIGILLFNFWFSGSLFKPFYKILEKMRNFRVGKLVEIGKTGASVMEFQELEEMVADMTNRINKDFKNLKEYTENMSHELQTPLAVIRNKLENLMGDADVMTKQPETVKSIYDEINHLSNLGNTLNLLTKIENGEFQSVERVSTKEIIEKHLEAVRELADLKELTIKADLSPNHFLEMDPFLLDIVIKNLLRNSIRYGSRQGPIKIVTTSDSFEISNFGDVLGFPENRIFERFKNQQNNDSLGLGLAITKKICELNNLEIIYKYHDNKHLFTIRFMA